MLEVIAQEHQRDTDTDNFWCFISHRHRLLFITLRSKKDKNRSIGLSLSHEGPMLVNQYHLSIAITWPETVMCVLAAAGLKHSSREASAIFDAWYPFCYFYGCFSLCGRGCARAGRPVQDLQCL